MSVAVTPASLAPDPAFPQRDLLLDSATLAPIVAEAFGLDEIPEVTRVSTRYRPGRALRLGVAVSHSQGRFLVGTRTTPAGAARPRRRPGIIVAEGIDTALWRVPDDRKLHHLPWLTDGAPGLVHDEVRAELLRYVPEKRATARLVHDEGPATAYAKVFASPSEAASCAAVHDEVGSVLRGMSAVRTPQLVGRSPHHHAVALSPMDGDPIHDSLCGADAPRALTRLGSALAQLHGARAIVPACAQGVADPMFAASLIARARPDLAAPLAGIARALESSRPATGRVGLLHGDLHLKNVLDDGDALSFIDLDLAGTGPVARELGAVISRLRLAEIAGRVPDGVALEDALLAGYSAEAPVPAPAALRWHVAAALVDRAVGGVRQVKHEVIDALPAIVAAADDARRSG